MTKFLTTLVLTAAVLSACTPAVRKESAQRTALPVHMIPRTVPASPFTLQAYERVHEKFTTAVLYIEGDGQDYGDKPLFSFSDTRMDPIGVRLAAQDSSTNVIYLARPCQYRGKYKDNDNCPKVFGGDARYSPAVIAGYNAALDNIKAYYDITGFDIVGYDGGAAIATILAAQRADINSLRTVAGNLDTKTSSYLNKSKPMDKSLNPVDYASQLTGKPQRHFIGKLDKTTPPAVYNSYAQALGYTTCNAVTFVENADHEHGWVEQWNTLRTLPVGCTVAVEQEPAPVPFDPSVLDGDKGTDHGQK